MELRVARQKVGQILITEKLYTTHTLAQRGEISAAFRDDCCYCSWNETLVLRIITEAK